MKTRVYHLWSIQSNGPLLHLHHLKSGSLTHQIQCRRRLHSSKQAFTALTIPSPSPLPLPTSATRTTASPSVTSTPSSNPPLSILPRSTISRTLLISTISSFPALLQACFNLLGYFARSKSAIANVDRNPLLHWLLKKTFYAQFCAGENVKEVKASLEGLRKLGYEGVVLEYALEVLGDDHATTATNHMDVTGEKTRKDVETWRNGMFETVNMVSPGDFVGAKWSGLGTSAFRLLRANEAPTPDMSSAMHEVCSLAASRGASLLIDAEESSTNVGIEQWTQAMQQQYNIAGRAVVYTTIQAYLKSAPAIVSQHLEHARQHGYTLGIKLVRGAYLNSEPAQLLCSSKEATDAQFDAIAEALLRRRGDGILAPLRGQPAGGRGVRDNIAEDKVPDVALVLATHNAASIRKAQAIRAEQAEKGEKRIELAYAQLMGMADEVSCALLQDAEAARAAQVKAEAVSRKPLQGDEGREVRGKVDVPKVYKLLNWGTVGQSLNFLLRRAAENKEAAGRTREGRDVMAREVWRRVRKVFGLGHT